MVDDLPRVRSARAVRESGYVVDPTAASFWGSLAADAEETPELRWPLSVQVYDRMRRQDPQVQSVLRAVTHPVRRTAWKVDPNGARDEVVAHVSEDLNLPVLGAQDGPRARTRDRFSWSEHLQQALLMLVFGHMFFEQVYRIDVTGLARLRKLGPRMPRTITRLEVARDGGLQWIEQGGLPIGSGTVKIPVNRLVAYVHEREGGDWAGQSILRSAYAPWLLKDRMLRVNDQGITRNSMGIPVFTNPSEDEGGNSDTLAAGKDMASALRAGDNSGVGLPAGATLRLMGVDGATRDPLPTIRYYDEKITQAVLAHVLNLGSKTGSYALSSTFADIFSQSLQAIAQHVADVTTAHVIEDIVDINYGPDEPAPRLVFDEIGSKSAAIAQAVKLLVDSGAITPDQGLEAFMRSSLGLPAATGDPLPDPADPNPEGGPPS